MLLIIAEGQADRYTKHYKSKCKPSDYCRHDLRLGKDIKKYDYWRDYFADIDKLLNTLRQYSYTASHEHPCIYDLLQEKYKH